MPGCALAIDLDPDTLDPAGQTNPDHAPASSTTWPKPWCACSPTAASGPGLARKFTQSADGRSFTFELRPDVEFHDGAPLDAEAVNAVAAAFSRTRTCACRCARRSTPTWSTASPSVDPLTLRITLKDTSRLFLQKLAATELAIVSPAHARGFPDTLQRGAGRHRPVPLQGAAQGRERRPRALRPLLGQAAVLPALQFRIVPEVATRESLLLANQVEMILQPPLSDLPALQNNPALQGAADADGALDVRRDGPDAARRDAAGDQEGAPGAELRRSTATGSFATCCSARRRRWTRRWPRRWSATRASAGTRTTSDRARQLLLEGGTPQLQLRFIASDGSLDAGGAGRAGWRRRWPATCATWAWIPS